jgi:adenine-specific DNA-methyltransferase
MLTGTIKNENDFKLEDKYKKERGKYNLQQFDWASLTYTPSLDYPIEAPDKSLIYPGHVNRIE